MRGLMAFTLSEEAQRLVRAYFDGWITGTTFASLHAGKRAPFSLPAVVPIAQWIQRHDRGWLAGSVRDARGNLMDGAVVEVRRAGGFPFRHKDVVLTDGNGFFGTSALEPGRYEVTVSGKGKHVVPWRR